MKKKIQIELEIQLAVQLATWAVSNGVPRKLLLEMMVEKFCAKLKNNREELAKFLVEARRLKEKRKEKEDV